MKPPGSDFRPQAWLFWASVWLAIGLIAIKSYYLGMPGGRDDTGQIYIRALAAISYADVLFVGTAWALARVTLALVGRWRPAAAAVTSAFVALGAFFCVYQIPNVVVFSSFGGFLTYPLLALVGDVRMLRSSVGAYLSPAVVSGLVGVPLVYLAGVWISVRRQGASAEPAKKSDVLPLSPQRSPRTPWVLLRGRGGLGGRSGFFPHSSGRHLAIATTAIAWIVIGSDAYSARWRTRSDRAIAENPEWVFVSSWWRTLNGGNTVRMADGFDPADLEDFEPIGARAPSFTASGVPGRRGGRTAFAGPDLNRSPQPLNVIMIVLESVAARWTSLHSRIYTDTTPSLVAESAHGLVFDRFYAHIGRSSNSLVSMLLSIYPKLDFRDVTDEYPHLAGTSLASAFQDRGYRTAFITPSDLSWAGWAAFLEGRGFGDIIDYHKLSCTDPLTSWGVEDRCMVDGIIDFINRDPTRPFFLMGWTQQTHHPYEPTLGIPLLDLVREPVRDDYELNRYLNILRETDRHLGRLFEAIRIAGMDQHTLVVIVGDHGQAFGYPHEANYFQGRTVYEEDVNVPLLFWYPGRYKSAARPATIGAHVDLAPTIAELAGLPAAPDWQGRSLLQPEHIPRAYFYVAEDFFRLGVREDNWKYIYDLREAREELYDLDHDPTEQRNVAKAEPQRSARLRQRLAAWAEANRRQYQRR